MNIWKTVVEDSKGKQKSYQSRGPTTVDEVMEAINRDVIGTQTKAAIAAGLPDPGLKIISIEPIGEDVKSDLGMWRPAGAKPVNPNEFVVNTETPAEDSPLPN